MEAISIQDPKGHSIKESEVIRRILGGEKELYEILVRRNNQKLYRIIRTYIKNGAEVEDVMQNTYLNAFAKLYQFKMESSFSTWLIRIGINEALSRLKEKQKLVHLNTAADTVKNTIVLEMPDKRQLNPQQQLIRKEATQLLENAIDSLNSKYRSVYVLKEVEGMSLKEVADALDLSVGNVKIRLHRSKAMLKDKLYHLTSDNSVFEFGYSKCDRLTEYVMTHI